MDDTSFERFYESEYSAVLAFSRSLSPTRQHAEDIVHDAFEVALRKWRTIDNPMSWIRQVIANKTKSVLRRHYAEQQAIHRLSSQMTIGVDLPEDTEAFWAEVRRLPHRQRVAIALFYLEDRPVAEIAAVLGCAEATARVHLLRGRRSLADRLEEQS
ncbi:MAG: sigma-70 family RNA polymerase sigma factor [Acidimicrobiia bacterium]